MSSVPGQLFEGADSGASGDAQPVAEASADVAAPDAARESAGQTLARARREAGLSIEDIAQQLKFAPRQINALEQGRIEDLPGTTYVRGMVRGYARLLKLDAGELVARVSESLAAPDANRLAARYTQPVPFSDASRRVNVFYVAVSVALLAVVGAVAFEWHQERTDASRLRFVQAERLPAGPQGATVASVAAAPALGVAEPAPAADARSESGATPEVQPGPSGRHRIALKFARAAWVEIKDGSGRTLIAALNPGGSERVVEGDPPFSLIVGNAQHVRMTYDDRDIDLMPHVKVEVARFTLD